MRLYWLEPSRKVAKVYEASLHSFLKGGIGCVEVSLHWKKLGTLVFTLNLFLATDATYISLKMFSTCSL